MSKYTTEVRYICENAVGLDESKGFNDVNKIIKQSAPIIFDFDFPIFDESYRSELEEHILRHYYIYEIGFETVALWKMRLQSKLCDIMPYYNKLYESELIKIDPLKTKNMDRKHTSEGDSQTAGQQNTKNNDVDWNLFNDTPQGAISDVDDMTYLTTARKQTSDRNSDNIYQSANTSNEKFNENISGYDLRSPASLIKEYRETFLNIDMMIINDLQTLFMMVY